MNDITSIKLVLYNPKTHLIVSGYVYMLSQDRSMLYVYYTENTISPAVINIDDFRVNTCFVYYGTDRQVTKYFSGMTKWDSWNETFKFCSEKERSDNIKRKQKIVVTYFPPNKDKKTNQCFTEVSNRVEALKPVGRYMQSEAYDPSTLEILRTYYDFDNAVVIFPGSWIDKKLQEAYISKRSVAKEQKNNGKDTSN